MVTRNPIGPAGQKNAKGQVICGAKMKTRDGFCTQYPVKGGSRCRAHGGVMEPIVNKQRQLQAKFNNTLHTYEWQPILDPLGAIADLAGEIWAFKEICCDQIGQLEKWTGYDEKDMEYTRALVMTYERSLDRATKILTEMIRIGLDAAALGAAKARPSREQADVLGNVLDRVFAELNLTVLQKERIPEALRKALLAEDLL